MGLKHQQCMNKIKKMEYKKYLAHTEYDAQADIFHGEVINTRDVITFQGKSTDELRRALEDSVEDYLEFCKERGEEPNQPFSGHFSLHLSPELHRQIILAAEKSGKNMDNRISEALELAVKRNSAENLYI